MLNPKEMTAKAIFMEKFSQFLLRNRVLLWSLLISMAVLITGYFIWFEWNKRIVENSTFLAEGAQDLYQTWNTEEDQNRKNEIEEELLEALNLIIRKYPHQYAAERALFIKGNLFFEKENWDDAAKAYLDLAHSFAKGYLAPLSLFNAAVAYEELNESDKALANYKLITEKHSDNYLLPHALFSLGRLYEQKEEYDLALSSYNRLEDGYSASNWTKIARNRIIELTINGKIGK